MRLKIILMMGVLCATLPLPAAARVLVPGEDDASSTAKESEAPNLGLIPRPSTTVTPRPAVQQPRPAPAPAQPAQQPIAQAPAATPTESPSDPEIKLDTVDTSVLQSIDTNLLRQSMPSEFKDVSDSDIKKMVATQFGTDRGDLAKKYLKTDPKTGQSYVDFDQLQKDSSIANTKLTFTPGGKISAAKEWSAKDKLTASLLAKGNISDEAAEAIAGKRKLKFMNTPPLIMPNKGLTKYEGPMADKAEISVSIPKDYVWGKSDSQKIESQLGYTTESIPANCQLRVDVSLLTDDGKNLYNATIMSNASDKIGYSGMLKTIEARPYAVCNKPSGTLPSNGGIIFSYFDKYAIMLSQASCATTAGSSSGSHDKGPSSVIVQYAGDSKITCTFVK